MSIHTRVQSDDFDVHAEYRALLSQTETADNGAAVFFVGLVRDADDGKAVSALELEHYPQMTEDYLHNLAKDAVQRWSIAAARIVHRIGLIKLKEQIVFVGSLSKHRQACFESCAFMMDMLKTDVPLWKAEHIDTNKSKRWLKQRPADHNKSKKWQQK